MSNLYKDFFMSVEKSSIFPYDNIDLIELNHARLHMRI